MINATAINAVPVLEDVYAGTTQEWSLRLNAPQHGETHQVLTHRVRIDRATALSYSMDHGASSFFVGGVTCLVNSVSI